MLYNRQYFYKVVDKYNSIQDQKKSLPMHFVLRQFIILVFFRANSENPKHKTFWLSIYNICNVDKNYDMMPEPLVNLESTREGQFYMWKTTQRTIEVPKLQHRIHALLEFRGGKAT